MAGRGPAGFASRLRRTLLMIPWLLEREESTVEELAAQFGVSEGDVIKDLNLIMCCGVPPYGADQLITVVLDEDGSVMAWKGPFFNRPMRLTPTEGFAVLAAGRALLAVPGADQAGALSSAMAKLEAALGSAGSVAVDLEAPEFLGALRSAVEAGQRVAVGYFSAWRDEITERVIDPYLVFASEGHWYVAAGDSRRGQVLQFRVDRMRSVEPTGERFDRPADAPTQPPERVFTGGPEVVETTLVLPASARWVADAYHPIGDIEDIDGGDRFRVTLPIAGERWLERLLLRIGPEAVVESPPSMAGVGAAAARRLLERYGA